MRAWPARRRAGRWRRAGARAGHGRRRRAWRSAAGTPRAPPAGATGLPVPRFVSLKSDRVNLRQGPGTEYPTAWVFRRAGLPVEVIKEFESWRQVRDAEGTTGWVLGTMLSGRRTAVILPWEVQRRAAATRRWRALRDDDSERRQGRRPGGSRRARQHHHLRRPLVPRLGRAAFAATSSRPSCGAPTRARSSSDLAVSSGRPVSSRFPRLNSTIRRRSSTLGAPGRTSQMPAWVLCNPV